MLTNYGDGTISRLSPYGINHFSPSSSGLKSIKLLPSPTIWSSQGTKHPSISDIALISRSGNRYHLSADLECKNRAHVKEIIGLEATLTNAEDTSKNPKDTISPPCNSKTIHTLDTSGFGILSDSLMCSICLDMSSSPVR